MEQCLLIRFPGVKGTVGVARVCSVNRSSKLSFLFREYADGSRPGALDPVHRGPCAVYMKLVVSALNDTAMGAGCRYCPLASGFS